MLFSGIWRRVELVWIDFSEERIASIFRVEKSANEEPHDTTSQKTAESESESYVTTDGQSASLSWNKAHIWGLRPDFYYRQRVVGALSDERTGLSFTIAAESSQRNHSRVRVSWDSRPYFTVSDLRLPFSSPPTTRRVTVEIFDPASTRVYVCRPLNWVFATALSGKFLCFYNFGKTVYKSPPSMVPVLLFISALFRIHL
jgi:hypothetical protein